MTEEEKKALAKVATTLTEIGVADADELLAHLLTKHSPLVLREIKLIPGLSEKIGDYAKTAAAVLLEKEGLAQRRNGKTVRLYPTNKGLRLGKLVK